MSNNSQTPTVLDGVAINATVYSKWIPTARMAELGIQVYSDGVGSPAGTWSFEGTNDPVAKQEAERERDRAAVAIGASTGAKTFPMPTTTLQGASLTSPGTTATASSYVAWVQGLPNHVRVKYTASGGSASSKGWAWTTARSFGG